MSVTFNLIDEKWIPVLYQGGTVDRVGILKALEDANRIRQIAASNPMDRIAILRFLLAVLYWCKGNPDSHPVSSLPAEWFAKLSDYKGCFNILGNGERFYQYMDYADHDKKLSANYLVQEVPTGTNCSHFRHSMDGIDGLCPACCAMGLLRLPLFATSGGRGKPPGVNAKPPIYVIPIGASLAETLLLSWVKTDLLGKPFWEQPSGQLLKLVPLLAGLTWVPRRVWLDEPSEPRAACNSCGRWDRLVRLSVFAPIGSQKIAENEQDRVWRDPHVIHNTSDQPLYAANALAAPDAAAGQWTRIICGIPREQRTDHRAWGVGFATVQNDKYLEAMEYLIPLSRSIDEIEPVTIEQWSKETKKIASKCRPQGSPSSRKHVEIEPAIAAIRPHVEGKVSTNAGELLIGEDGAWQKAVAEYGPMMQVIAGSLSPGFTTAALQRRMDIENKSPRMPRKA